MAHDYYASLDSEGLLVEKFKDIDDKIQFSYAMRRLQDPLTRNFVLDFGNEDAWCASDLNSNEMELLLSKPVRLFETLLGASPFLFNIQRLTGCRNPSVLVHGGCESSIPEYSPVKVCTESDIIVTYGRQRSRREA